MIRFKTTVWCSQLFAALAVLSIPAQAQLAVSYYTVQGYNAGTNTGSHDFHTSPCGVCNTYYTNEFKTTLGPDGLPVANTSPPYAGTDIIQDKNAAGEVTWWSPSMNANVTAAGAANVNHVTDTSFFPPTGSGSGDTSGFMTAIFKGSLETTHAGSYTFSFGADDDAILVVNGSVVDQIGGIHGAGQSLHNVTLALNNGDNSFELFFADRQITDSSIVFNIPENVRFGPPSVIGIEGAPGPIPGAGLLSYLALGALGIGRLAWSRRRALALR